MSQEALTMTPLIDRQRLAARITEIGRQISRDYAGQELIIVGVLKGSFIFLADLVRAINLPLEIEFIGCSSYVGTESTGHVRITTDLSRDIAGRHVLLVEDIVDTGVTIDYLLDTLSVRRPASLKFCTLLSKRENHAMSHKLDYVAFEIGPEFVVGYGLDLDGRYRELPEIMQVKV